MSTGYVSGLKIARSVSGIGLMEFEVTTPGNAIPSTFYCGTAPVGKAHSVVPTGYALVSIDADCLDAANNGSGRRRSLLAGIFGRTLAAYDGVGRTLGNLRIDVAQVDSSAPLTGGALAVKRINVPCDGRRTFQVRSASLTSVSLCAPITAPCDLSNSFASVMPNTTTDRVCSPLATCDPGLTYEIVKPTPNSDRVCADVAAPCTGTTTWESQAPTALRDRICSPVSPQCVAGTTFESQAPSPLHDRVCSPVSVCDGITTFETRNPTELLDRVCSPVTLPCDLSVSYASVQPSATTNRVCSPLSPSCDGKYKYETTAPTPNSDRQCGPISPPCDGIITYQSIDPSPLLDRLCSSIAPRCVAGTTYQSAAPTPLQNRVCSPVTPDCDGVTNYESRAPTELLDRVCTNVSPLCDGIAYYTQRNATTTSDRVCRPVSYCDGIETYQTIDSTPYSDRVCVDVSPPCGSGTYQTAPPSRISDRICSNATVCDGTTQFQAAAATAFRDTICANVTQCIQDVTYRSAPPNATTDATCTPVTQCKTNQFLSSNATLLADRVCMYPNDQVQCRYEGNYGAPSGYSVNSNDIVLCINQQTAPGYYTKSGDVDCTYGRVKSNFPSSPPPNPYLNDYSVRSGGLFGPTCTVTVYNPSGVRVGAIRVNQDFDLGFIGQSANSLDVFDASNGSAFLQFGPGTTMPSVSNQSSSLGGLEFRAYGAYNTNGRNTPSILEIFGPTCNSSAISTIYNVALLGDPYNITSKLDTPDTQNTGLAQVTGHAVNCRETTQSADYQVSVTRSRMFSYADALATANKYTVGADVKLSTPKLANAIIGGVEVTFKFSYERSDMQTITSTVADTETSSTSITLEDSIPPVSNCSMRGTVATSTVYWSQDVEYTYRGPCSDTPMKLKSTVNAAASGYVLTDTGVKVTYDQCAPPDLDMCRPLQYGKPAGVTCKTNVRCAAAGFKGQCCPTEDGRYLGCCAQAIAHPKCDNTTYTRITDDICPSPTNVYASCCS